MTATILVVDDEPDLEALVLQKFRRQIRDGLVQFVFAHDGIEALQSIEASASSPSRANMKLITPSRICLRNFCSTRASRSGSSSTTRMVAVMPLA